MDKGVIPECVDVIKEVVDKHEKCENDQEDVKGLIELERDS